jgi:hypothetical protein
MHTFTKSRQDNGVYLYVVGYWCPPAYNDSKTTWTPLRDCDDANEAAAWVNYLNGGNGDYPESVGRFE